MEYKDFEIGKEFYSGGGKWICTDKGTRTIVAVKLMGRHPYVEGGLYDCLQHWEMKNLELGNYAALDEELWTPIDFGGCSTTDEWA